jgi:SulP family sulfate permease
VVANNYGGFVLDSSKNQLVPSVVGGVVSGFYVVIFMFSYAALIFSGDLAQFMSNGIGALLVGAVVIALVSGLMSQIPGLVAAPNDNPVAITAIMAIAIAEAMPKGASPETIYTSIVVAIGVTSLLCGVVFIVVAKLNLASFVRFIPYPVIGGFLAGTGLIIFRGSFVASADVPLTLATLGDLLSADVAKLWIPALLFGILMMAVLMKFSHFLIVPGVVIVALSIFHGWRALSGMSIAEAADAGWLLQTVSSGGIWKPISISAVQAAEWPIILAQGGTIATLIIIGVIAVLLNSTALESAFGTDVDMSRELMATGTANVIAAFGGSVAGYHYVGMTTLMEKMGASSRLVGVMIAVVGVFGLIFGPSFIAYVPKFLLGGLAFFIGLAFLYDWVYESIRKLSKLDVGIILLIMVSMTIWGPLQGVFVGLVATVILFVINYSRINVIKHSFTGVSLHSSVDRPRDHRRILHDNGKQISIVRLQGFVFFGTASRLLDQIRVGSEGDDSPLRYVILDFQQVSGLDSSALHVFVKMKQIAKDKDMEIIYADVNEATERTFRSETFIDGSPLVEHYYRDLDHALEYAEDQVLKQFDCTPAVDQHPLDEWLTTHLGDAEAAKYVESLLRPLTVQAGESVVKEGEKAKALYFVEKGKLTVQLEQAEGTSLRLRTIGAGSVVGAAAMFMDEAHHNQLATVTVDETATLHMLPVEALDQMRRENIAAALAFQTFMLSYLGERLGKSLHLVERLMTYES